MNRFYAFMAVLGLVLMFASTGAGFEPKETGLKRMYHDHLPAAYFEKP